MAQQSAHPNIANGPVRTPAVRGIEKPVSRVALGFEAFESLADAAPILDGFLARGGTVLDTAHIYGEGRTEAILGQWMAERGVRSEVVVIGKGAHSPYTYPEVISAQLDESLARLQTDHVDVYLMHRDNPAVPVGEFVDAMDAQVSAGRIRGPFGGSNWTRERMDEAIAYARASGKRLPGVLSNNFSLAEMVDPVWPGCVSARSPLWGRWLSETGIVNLAWSSQARGFFTDRAGRDRLEDAELVRCWYSEANFARRERALALADRLGRSPIHIALAYCLNQAFSVLPLIGPRSVAELEDSLSATDIVLTPQEIAWLDEGAGQGL